LLGDSFDELQQFSAVVAALSAELNELGSTITMVVPDGVAKVTLRYPAGRASGYSPKIAPAFTTTTAPVGNLVVVTLPRSNPLQRGTIIWRSADGRVIETFHGLGT
jgi:hypothetical protein